MDQLKEKKKEEEDPHQVAAHLSNERTLLAWVRTSIGIMAFGFVVVRFSLFVKELNLAIGAQVEGHQNGYSGPIGIIFVAAGAISLLFALLRYRRTKKEINSGAFQHSDVLLNMLVLFIFAISILLMVYLIKTL